MKTCRRFATIKQGFEREIHYLRSHADRHQGRAVAKTSAKGAISARLRMATALNRHLGRCPECG
jgi:hypothetical protein